MDNKAINKISYGLFVISANENGKDNGCIVNTVIQVTSQPNRISVAINKSNFTHDMILRTGKFAVSVISQDAGFDLFNRFGFRSGREVNKFDGFSDYERGKNGLNHVTKGTNAFIEAKVEQNIDLGTHTLFIAEITDMEIISEVSSATYEYYHNNIKTQAINKEEKNNLKSDETAEGKNIWKCMICGYIYEGEELPADFVCPICKHPADDFEKITI